MDDGAPGKEEVLRQLKRLLESKRLRASQQRCALLQYVVEKGLDGQEISEDVIGYDLFRGYEPDKSDVVRVTASQLRQKLSLYYAEEGAQDGVHIQLPRGPKYRPVFSYSSPAAKAYARGLQQFAAMTVKRDHLNAVAQLNNAIALDPAYAPAHAVMAEIKLTFAAYGQFPDTKEYLAQAEASANEALRLSPRLWRPHVVFGMLHCCRFDWRKAQASFRTALKASREDTERHAWYAAYLLAAGRKKKALQLVGERAMEAPADPASQNTLALFLYATREYEKAEASLGELGSNHWLTKVALACIGLARGSREAWFHIEHAHTRFGVEAFPGFHALCLCGGDTETQQKGEAHARDWLPHLKEAHLQAALCHLALGEPQQAIAALRRARDAHDPLMIWAHVWPFVDPLRKYKRFQRLLDEMNFPAGR
jgi:Tfp pilus assembly protein PilF